MDEIFTALADPTRRQFLDRLLTDQGQTLMELIDGLEMRRQSATRHLRVLEDAGLIVSGTSPDGRLVEIIEVADHPWFVACQFHPEFASTPFRPSPLFVDFITAARKYAAKRDR